VFESELPAALGLLEKTLAGVREFGTMASGSELVSVLAATRALERAVSQLQVEAVAALERNGVFAEQGYRRPDSAIANVLTVERARAQQVVKAAELVCPRIDLQGQELPARLPRDRGRLCRRRGELAARRGDRCG
jgi:hypothetical protein